MIIHYYFTLQYVPGKTLVFAGVLPRAVQQTPQDKQCSLVVDVYGVEALPRQVCEMTKDRDRAETKNNSDQQHVLQHMETETALQDNFR